MIVLFQMELSLVGDLHRCFTRGLHDVMAPMNT